MSQIVQKKENKADLDLVSGIEMMDAAFNSANPTTSKDSRHKRRIQAIDLNKDEGLG